MDGQSADGSVIRVRYSYVAIMGKAGLESWDCFFGSCGANRANQSLAQEGIQKMNSMQQLSAADAQEALVEHIKIHKVRTCVLIATHEGKKQQRPQQNATTVEVGIMRHVKLEGQKGIAQDTLQRNTKFELQGKGRQGEGNKVARGETERERKSGGRAGRQGNGVRSI